MKTLQIRTNSLSRDNRKDSNRLNPILPILSYSNNNKLWWLKLKKYWSKARRSTPISKIMSCRSNSYRISFLPCLRINRIFTKSNFKKLYQNLNKEFNPKKLSYKLYKNDSMLIKMLCLLLNPKALTELKVKLTLPVEAKKEKVWTHTSSVPKITILK